jgi:hypothetical protein
MSQRFDLCLAWNWEYDQGFVELLQAACDSRRMSLLQATPDNLATVLEKLARSEIGFDCFFDRASESDTRFCALVGGAESQAIAMINPASLAERAWDKAEMYAQFNHLGLLMPETCVIPSFQDQAALPPIDLSRLGDNLVIKPAHGGGGMGVHVGITGWEQIEYFRQEYPDDQYLVQSYVHVAMNNDRPAWFRVIYCAGAIFPCWWHPDSHVYQAVSEVEELRFGLQPLRSITDLIRRICRLDLFSTEIALTLEGKFLVIDYVNDPIDLRLQSQAADALPDDIGRAIAERLADIAGPYKDNLT